MKRFIILSQLVLVLLYSCESKLDQIPETDKVSENFYSSEDEIEEAVLAVYATLQFAGNYDYGIPAMGELPGEDAYDETPANDGGVYGQLDQYDVIPQNGLIGDIWEDSYMGIQRANIVLNRINGVDFASNTTKESRIGEMHFIRGLLYFNLVRIFGDVPLVTEEVVNPQENFGQERADVQEIYNLIISDALEAIELLPDRTERNKDRAFKTAAQTLLGRVYLTLGDYQNAKELFSEVVNSGSHGLLQEVEDVFDVDNELNREIIFAVQFASGLDSNSEGTDAYRLFNPTGRKDNNMTGTKGHGVLKSDFYNLYETKDKRKDVYVGALSSGIGYNNKIAVPTTEVGDAQSDWVVFRYADVILLLAEIENELGFTGTVNDTQPGTALGYLNMIRTRAGIGKYSGNTDKSSVFKEIDLQRRKELVWEGHRWFDLLRQNRALEVLGITEEFRLLMPIPSNQIATDGALKQNPGY